MTNKNKKRDLPSPLENFTRGLLATTCLTVACGVSATAGTITEGTLPAPTDFPNSGPGYLLPGGTDTVIGTVGSRWGETGNFDSADWFEFTGLTPGTTYIISGLDLGVDPSNSSRVGENGVSIAYDSYISNVLTPITPITGEQGLEVGEAGGNVRSATFLAPANGIVVVRVTACNTSGEGGGAGCSARFFGAEGGIFPGGPYPEAPYTVTLDAADTSTPEPGTVGVVGVGLGALALAWRRRRAS